MVEFKYFLLAICLVNFLTHKIVSGNSNTVLELQVAHEAYLSRKSVSILQELDEELCELQTNLTTSTLIFGDATGKTPSGVLIGNLNHFGQYDQCLSIDETVQEVNIRGKYCMMHATLTLGEDASEYSLPDNMPSMMSMSGRFGVCVPNACEGTFVDLNDIGIAITSEELYCREANDKPIAAPDIVAIVLFSILGMILILSTVYHLTFKFLFNKDVSKIAKSFSVHHNMTRLTNIPKSGNPLSCINGVRALSMLWVILGHTYQTAMLGTFENTGDLFTWLSSASATKITASPLAVDTFLYMTAFLLTWSLLKKFKTPVAFTKSIPLLYLSRYLRLTPTMAAAMLLQVSLLNHCLGHSWYLAIDMQLYLAVPILLVFLFMAIKFAITALVVASLASLGAAIAYCFYYNFGVMFAVSLPNIYFMERYYINTIPRSPPYVVGIVVAYVVFSLKKRNIRLTGKIYIAFHWIITGVLLALPIYGTYSTIAHDHCQTAINFFNAWHRPAWVLGVSGIIVASMHGFGGPVGWFLSLDMWVAPARLSYAMYVIHYPLMASIVGSQKSPGRFSDAIMLVRFISDLGLTVLIALGMNVVVEAPFAELTNLLLTKLTGSKGNDQSSKGKDELPSSLEDGKGMKNDTSTSLEGLSDKVTIHSEESIQLKDNDLTTHARS